ncbi:hypothetical protein BS50DRAFT_616695 [Corynespora cassiicola Philippines]|uniref:DUF7704 domain-containing protein n=1 Tax=Corynespora cassiicola Philippines TaxID=1448308 RepID=A0A2T2P6H0_CORCC|nr:hypothetical protein BS50DRAFT_616695 [Corynespora cassiicola Philippines]
MTTPNIHSFYRIWFTIVDPTVLFFTVLTCIVSPATLLGTILPPSVVPYDSLSHGILLYQIGALYAFMGIMYGVLQRATSDLRLWKIVQGATLMVDLSLIVVFYVSMVKQNKTDLSKWLPGDWFNLLFTTWVALIRVAFLGGLGVSEDKVKRP